LVTAFLLASVQLGPFSAVSNALEQAYPFWLTHDRGASPYSYRGGSMIKVPLQPPPIMVDSPRKRRVRTPESTVEEDEDLEAAILADVRSYQEDQLTR
jgi:hypothetical protein